MAPKTILLNYFVFILLLSYPYPHLKHDNLTKSAELDGAMDSEELTPRQCG